MLIIHKNRVQINLWVLDENNLINNIICSFNIESVYFMIFLRNSVIIIDY